MLKKLIRYSLRATIYLARYSHEGCYIGAEEISEATKISLPSAASVLQQMVRNGLVNSKRGKNGGFYMTAEQKSNSVSDIMSSFSYAPSLSQGCILGLKDCDGSHQCPFHEDVKQLREEIDKIYSKRPVEEIAQKVYS